MRLRIPGIFLQALGVPVALAAAPMAVIDTLDYNAGTVIEGQMPVVKHSFKVKNTGDSALVIQGVKPG